MSRNIEKTGTLSTTTFKGKEKEVLRAPAVDILLPTIHRDVRRGKAPGG